MTIFYLAALAAALCWAITPMISTGPSSHLGAIAFTRIRMGLVFVMLALWVLATGSWRGIEMQHLGPLIASGAIGIFVGDTALFATLNRLGPRRTSVLYAGNAPLAALLGWLFLGESLSLAQTLGILTVFAGVALAIIFGKRRSQMHHWEEVKGPLMVGIALGLAAALGQAVGALIARPAMAGGVDAAAASMIRVGASLACCYAALILPFSAQRQQNKLTLKIAGLTALSGFIAMALGMTFFLYALGGGDDGKIGIVTTLAATAPVLLLPLIWLKTGERPATGAWFGAGLVVAGSWLIFGG